MKKGTLFFFFFSDKDVFYFDDRPTASPRPLCTDRRGRRFSSFLCLLLLGQSLDDLLLLGLKALLSALAGLLGLRPAGLGLVSQQLLVGLVGLQLVDVLHEDALVLEHVPLHLQIQAVVHVAVNLLRFTVSPEQPAQNPHPPHPGHLLRHPGVGCTLSLTYAHPIFDQLPDLLMGVGIGDFVGLIGVQPDLLLATAEDTGGEPLLKPEHAHGCGRGGERKGRKALFFSPKHIRDFRDLSLLSSPQVPHGIMGSFCL
uniref:Uncharacterized protein n=1 Tax=Oryctolagus cuniculus TaxID=9986 RepID=A0A5F9CTW9_RABIT